MDGQLLASIMGSSTTPKLFHVAVYGDDIVAICGCFCSRTQLENSYCQTPHYFVLLIIFREDEAPAIRAQSRLERTTDFLAVYVSVN